MSQQKEHSIARKRIGVIGGGKMGIALGSAFARAGHEVRFGSREPERVMERLRTSRVQAGIGTHREAVEFGEVIVLATRWEETAQILEEAGDFEGKVLLSCTNPATETEAVAVGHTTSAAETIAGWAPTARVVEAFVDIYSEFLNDAPDFNTPVPTVLYCGDDADARGVAGGLIAGLGFDGLDAGPLRNARYMEPLAALVVYFVRKRGFGPRGIAHQWKR